MTKQSTSKALRRGSPVCVQSIDALVELESKLLLKCPPNVAQFPDDVCEPVLPQKETAPLRNIDTNTGDRGAIPVDNIVARDEANTLSREKSVGFSTVNVREYGLVPGDSPNIKGGYPLMLSWNHAEEWQIRVDKFEEKRASERCGLRRIPTLDPTERRCRIRTVTGMTQTQVRNAETQRKMMLTREWAYGNDAEGKPKGFPVEITKTFLIHYVV